MGHLARRSRAAAVPGGGLPGSRDDQPAGSPARHRAGHLTAVLATVTVLSLSGLGSQIAFRAQPGQAAVAAAAHARQGASRHLIPRPYPGTAGSAGRAQRPGTVTAGGTFGRIILPDLLIVAPRGLTQRQVARLGKIRGVRNSIAFDGAQITVGGRSVSAIGVNPATFRSWVPVRTASSQGFWTALSNGEFVSGDSVAARLRLRPGASYELAGAVTASVQFGRAARLGLNGVDLLVNRIMSRRLGLVHQVAALISAPGVSMTRLRHQVSAIAGPGVRMESLRTQQLPVTRSTGTSLPTTYLQLFKESAARYCPGLSWTVLAAIGQIESGDGTNVGPSSAGALGPMQFMPATWAQWGIRGFGRSGQPDVMDPYDAVPSAARLLCADGAAAGGQSLYRAVFGYNHADWYVREVLGLAARYAAEYH
ncbi:MAG TPA: lytic transglycosylase domain-containing protein [Streptosporangiaceae bacterium]|nr:lytic transglycosylase domain-containing protein [Streptosporangiaceae bacterium]